MDIVWILLLPLLGTTVGASFVFLMKGEWNGLFEKMLLGFSAGVMMAASIWSLLLPSIEMANEYGSLCWVPAVSGFLVGIVFLYLFEEMLRQSQNQMYLAVTIHNIPEGMAVGVACAGIGASNALTEAAAFALALGIAIQNVPEGAIISMPLRQKGWSKRKAFWYGVLSGSVEPMFGMITVLFINSMNVALPFVLSFAAGVMFYVILDELVPKASTGTHGRAGTISSAMGFVLMMILDVVL